MNRSRNLFLTLPLLTCPFSLYFSKHVKLLTDKTFKLSMAWSAYSHMSVMLCPIPKCIASWCQSHVFGSKNSIIPPSPCDRNHSLFFMLNSKTTSICLCPKPFQISRLGDNVTNSDAHLVRKPNNNKC